MKKIHFVYICLVILSLGLLLVSCEKKSNSFKPSDKAIVFEYPEDNIASLKSITIDEDDAGSIYVFKFLKDGSFVTDEELKSVVSDFSSDKSCFGCANWNESTLEQITINAVTEFTDENFTYVLLHLEGIDTSVDDIIMRDAEWSFNLSIVDSFDKPVITTYRNGIYNEDKCIDGEMKYVQSYDSASGTWSDIYEKFIPRAATN